MKRPLNNNVATSLSISTTTTYQNGRSAIKIRRRGEIRYLCLTPTINKKSITKTTTTVLQLPNIKLELI